MRAYKEQYEQIITTLKGTHNDINAIEDGASASVGNAIWGVRVALNAVEWAIHGLLKAFEILENGKENEGKGENEEKDS